MQGGFPLDPRPRPFAASLTSFGPSARAPNEGALPPQTPRRGSGSGVGIPWGGDAVRRPFGSACPPMVPSRNQPSSPTWARKGSMSRCAHRPLSQSVFWLDRRVNSAIRERVGLDLRERRPRRPVVTHCCIDPSTRTVRTSFALRPRLRRRSRLAARPSACADTRAPSALTASRAC